MKWKGHHDLGLDGVTLVAYFTAQFRNFHGEPEGKHEIFTMIVAHWPEFELCPPHPHLNTNIWVYWHKYLLCEEQYHKYIGKWVLDGSVKKCQTQLCNEPSFSNEAN